MGNLDALQQIDWGRGNYPMGGDWIPGHRPDHRLQVKIFFLKKFDTVGYLMSFFRFPVIGKFLEIALWLRISRISRPKKNPENLQGELGDS